VHPKADIASLICHTEPINKKITGNGIKSTNKKNPEMLRRNSPVVEPLESAL